MRCRLGLIVGLSYLSSLSFAVGADSLSANRMAERCFKPNTPYNGMTTVSTECLDQISELSGDRSKLDVQLLRMNDQYYLEIQKMLYRGRTSYDVGAVDHDFYLYRSIKIPVRISPTWFGIDLLVSGSSRNAGYSQTDGDKYTSKVLLPADLSRRYQVQDLFSSFEGSYGGLGAFFIGFAKGVAAAENGLKIRDIMATLFGIPGSTPLMGGAWFRYSLMIEVAEGPAQISYWGYSRDVMFCQQETEICRVKNLSRQVPSYSVMGENL